MNTYNFREVFVRYTIILTVIMAILYGGLVMIYNAQVNTEIKETSEQNLKDLKTALQSNEAINQGRYYVIKTRNQFINHTKLSNQEISSILSKMKAQSSYKYEGSNGVFNFNQDQVHNRTIYSVTDVSDYEETKDLLYNLMLFLMVFTLVLIVGAAYYLAIKPIRAYEEMLKAHQTFIQNTTHEMKTPIASVSLGIDYIKALEPNLSDTSKASLSKMKREIQYMQALIGKTLQIAPRTQITRHDIIPTIQHTIHQFEQLHDMHIEKRYGNELIYTVNDDDIKQMLTILLDNAIKHNDENIKLIVSVSVEKDRLKLEVIDNGKGIRHQDIPYIFDRYFRGDVDREGSGLGLDILKAIVKQYKGHIEVYSESYIQTKFILFI